MITLLWRSFTTFLLFFLVQVSSAQYPNVMIDEQDGRLSYPPCEPSIAVSPANPAIQVAGAVLDRVYHSTDSGKTWLEDGLTSDHGVFGDPCVVAGNKGDFYYLHLSDPSGNGWADPSLLDRIVCHHSKDGGKTWNDGAGMGLNPPKDQDKEWASINASGKRIAVTWTQFDKYNSSAPGDSTVILFSASNRCGKRWSEPIRINQKAGDCLDDDDTVEGAVSAWGPNDELYVAWALGEKIYFDRSMDNGKTWLEKDIVATPIIGGWDQQIPGINRCNGMPVTMCDLSGGPYHGRIYINWVDTWNGNHDVWMISSDDKGSSWTEPVRVNDDETERDQFFTWMAVDQVTGAVYTVFYDRRNYSDLQTDVYLATSTDGGSTFVNERISESPFIPSEIVFFGDYSNISAHDGVVRPIWTRCDGTRLSIWTALINK